MKTKILMAAVTVAILALGDSANVNAIPIVFDSGFANGGVVPDGNVTGWWDTRTVSGWSGQITDVNVTLNLSGGWNGDLYAYLSHGSGLVVLLNRVGVGANSAFGYDDAGMQVTLDDQAGDIHLYGASPITGGAAWQPDGRSLSPLSAPSAFDGAARLGLSTFNTMDPNGGWTLFVADVSGGEVSALTSWGLDITTTPATPVPDTGPGPLLAGSALVALLAAGGLRRRASHVG